MTIKKLTVAAAIAVGIATCSLNQAMNRYLLLQVRHVHVRKHLNATIAKKHSMTVIAKMMIFYLTIRHVQFAPAQGNRPVLT